MIRGCDNHVIQCRILQHLAKVVDRFCFGADRGGGFFAAGRVRVAHGRNRHLVEPVKAAGHAGPAAAAANEAQADRRASAQRVDGKGGRQCRDTREARRGFSGMFCEEWCSYFRF